MIDAMKFQQTEVLKNGITVKIRAICPSDKEGLTDTFSKLDPVSVQTRFFSAKKSLSDQELEAATDVDFENVIALVVTIESEGKENIIGGGRYVAFNTAGGRSAEIAFMVQKKYSGLGIAGRILIHLARIAREKGVGQFEAEVLPQNKAMLSVFRRSGFPMRVTPADGSIHVTLSLGS